MINVKKISNKKVEFERSEENLKIKAVFGFDEKIKVNTETGFDFLNRFVKLLYEEAGLRMDINIEKKGECDLIRSIAEVIGIGMKNIIEKNPHMKKISGSMSSVGNASSTITMKFSKNPYNPLQIKILGQKLKKPEDFFKDDLFVFFTGLSHGLEAEMEVTIVKSENQEETWESVFKATSGCFRDILKS